MEEGRITKKGQGEGEGREREEGGELCNTWMVVGVVVAFAVVGVAVVIAM